MNQLERQNGECPTCGGEGVTEEYHENEIGIYSEYVNCPTCHGKKTVPESAERWALRLKKIVEWLVMNPHAINTALASENAIQARINAAAEAAKKGGEQNVVS
jgi:excinuclease UvrABC ATPase subunit